MMVAFFIVGAVIGFITGYFCSKTKKSYNQIQIGGTTQTQEILLDAKSNREISEIVNDSDYSNKSELINKINKMINTAAQSGEIRLRLEHEYDLNDKIRRYLTKEDIIENFINNGYIVKTFDWYDGSYSIDSISWEEKKK